jgi:hypothetical protein
MRNIDIEDHRLTPKERTLLRQIAHRLDNWRDCVPTPPLPPAYQAELDRVFGSCAEDGDLSERGKR